MAFSVVIYVAGVPYKYNEQLYLDVCDPNGPYPRRIHIEVEVKKDGTGVSGVHTDIILDDHLLGTIVTNGTGKAVYDKPKPDWMEERKPYTLTVKVRNYVTRKYNISCGRIGKVEEIKIPLEWVVAAGAIIVTAAGIYFLTRR